jgi:hypothetical protein
VTGFTIVTRKIKKGRRKSDLPGESLMKDQNQSKTNPSNYFLIVPPDLDLGSPFPKRKEIELSEKNGRSKSVLSA